MMNIYPAIDIKNGKCVRLYQGDYAKETIYQEDPFLQAKNFITQGARWMHIVDLDGAKNPEQNQAALISRLIRENNINIQTGGGIRTRQQVEFLLNQGAKRVIIGSMAITHPKEVKQWISDFGADQLVFSFDVKCNQNNEAMIAINAWQDLTSSPLSKVLQDYLQSGLIHVLCTNISLDGTMSGPDYHLYETLMKQFPSIKLQASGGIHSIEDIRQLKNLNMDGAIIGRALYENKFTLREILDAC